MKKTDLAKFVTEILICLAISCFIIFVSHYTQPRISLNDGKGWDGVHYYSMAEQLSNSQLPSEGAPFVYRIGTPFLASIVDSDDLLSGFYKVNLFANFLSILLLSIWFRMHFRYWWLRSILLMCFITSWHGPIRFIQFYPAYVDPFLFVFIIGGLLCVLLIRENPSLIRISLFVLISFIAAFFREVYIIVPLSLMFLLNPIDSNIFIPRIVFAKFRNLKTTLWFPLFFCTLGLIYSHILVEQTNSYSFIRAAVLWTYTKSFASYILSWFVAYGPILVLPLYNYRRSYKMLKSNQPLLIFLVGFGLLAYIGGGDTTRFIYWSMPVVYLLIGKSVEDLKPLFSLPIVLILFIGQILSNRIFFIIPDFPNNFSYIFPILNPFGNKFPYLDLWPGWGNSYIQGLALAEYLGIATLIIFLLHRREHKEN